MPQITYTPQLKGVDGAEDFAIRRIFCVGRNYSEHAKEMGMDPNEPPLFFTKSPAAYAPGHNPDGTTYPFPPATDNLQYEMELVVALKGGGANISKDDAHAMIYGFASGLDMTRRDLQTVAREKGQCWSLAKDFETSALIGALHPASALDPIAGRRIWLDHNGTRKQDGSLAEMIWPLDALIAKLSTYYHLQTGDIIFTGTPAGVGPVEVGDTLVGRVEGLSPVHISFG